jgi:hypothetical protein
MESAAHVVLEALGEGGNGDTTSVELTPASAPIHPAPAGAR